MDHFESERLIVQDWAHILADTARRKTLERELESMINPKITHRLPANMEFPGNYASISSWVDDRQEEAQILCVHDIQSKMLAGLVILWREPGPELPVTYRVGYFFAEQFWGRGYATETLKSLVSKLKAGPAFLLLAGVDRDNVASATVLTKTGFKEAQDQATEGRLFFEFSND